MYAFSVPVNKWPFYRQALKAEEVIVTAKQQYLYRHNNINRHNRGLFYSGLDWE
jgi:hypothetical protein